MMAEEAASPALLKDIMGTSALETIADAGATASARFDRPTFLRSAADGLDALSIMERVRHIAGALHTALRWSYPEALDVIRAMAPRLPARVARASRVPGGQPHCHCPHASRLEACCSSAPADS